MERTNNWIDNSKQYVMKNNVGLLTAQDYQVLEPEYSRRFVDDEECIFLDQAKVDEYNADLDNVTNTKQFISFVNKYVPIMEAILPRIDMITDFVNSMLKYRFNSQIAIDDFLEDGEQLLTGLSSVLPEFKATKIITYAKCVLSLDSVSREGGYTFIRDNGDEAKFDLIKFVFINKIPTIYIGGVFGILSKHKVSTGIDSASYYAPYEIDKKIYPNEHAEVKQQLSKSDIFPNTKLAQVYLNRVNGRKYFNLIEDKYGNFKLI